MEKLTLYLGNKNYSSWSMRAWLVLRHAGLPFDEVLIPLDQPETTDAIARVSPSGRVPVLWQGHTVVWDSLAIAEYAAELAPHAHLWPRDTQKRAHARAVSAEMHSGFAALRQSLPFDMRARCSGFVVPRAARADIERVIACWSDCRIAHAAQGPFLFGEFSIADAMYAPVVSRFRTYGIPLPEICKTYCRNVESHRAYEEWSAAAAAEPYVLPSFPPPAETNPS